MKTPLLSTAYLPPIEYVLKCLQGVVRLEACENYIKQSYRNRTLIATANGVQALSIPVVHLSSKMPIRDVRIDYATPWQRLHWKSIDTAYSGSPYFLYFQDYLKPFYEKKYDFLFDYNLELTRVLLKLFGCNFQPQLTEEFIAEYSPLDEVEDLRNAIHPKRRQEAGYPFPHKVYTQIFEDRLGFVPNLSIIDCLFNEGNSGVRG